jgi:hypothetical protein
MAVRLAAEQAAARKQKSGISVTKFLRSSGWAQPKKGALLRSRWDDYTRYFAALVAQGLLLPPARGMTEPVDNNIQEEKDDAASKKYDYASKSQLLTHACMIIWFVGTLISLCSLLPR